MAAANVAAASLFGADSRLCSADILAPPEASAFSASPISSSVPFLWSQTGPISLSIGPGKDRAGRAQLPRRARLPLLAGHLRPPPGTPVAKLDSPTFLSYCGDGSACFFTALISRSSANCSLRSGLLNDVSSVYLSHTFCKRSLMHNPKAFVRVWKVMEMCYKILGEGKLVHQRELFYKLLSDSPKYFSCQRHVNQAIQDVVSLLRCTRQSLGVMASSRGALIGRLMLHEPDEEQIDCSILGASGHAITGDLNLLSKLNLSSDARYIIVVEKDAIFQRLAEDRLYNQLPCILITAKGYPDIATRFILHRLSQTFPNMPIFALVDWNPAGLAIMCTYKYGSISMGLESYRYACNVKWLGMRGDDLQLIPESAFQVLKPRDLQIAKSLLSSKFLQENHRAELTLMVERGKRADIEALYSHGFDYLGKFIARKIVQGDYI